MDQSEAPLRICLRDPIPEIAEAARYLDEAVSAHLTGRYDVAEELIRRADIPAIRDWSESLWGPKSPYKRYRTIANAPPSMHRDQHNAFMLLMDEYYKTARHCMQRGLPSPQPPDEFASQDKTIGAIRTSESFVRMLTPAGIALRSRNQPMSDE